MEMYLADDDEPRAGRFDDTRTTWWGRKIRLPVFYLDGERFSLSLANAQRAAQSVEAAQELLARCADLAGVDDRRGIEGNALLIHERCRRLLGVKDAPKRDRPREQRHRVLL